MRKTFQTWPFASILSLPTLYSIDYDYNGTSQIALVRQTPIPLPATTALLDASLGALNSALESSGLTVGSLQVRQASCDEELTLGLPAQTFGSPVGEGLPRWLEAASMPVLRRDGPVKQTQNGWLGRSV